jgi:hypothetical protein
MAESIWHEFHCSLHVGHVCELQLHWAFPLSWIGTVFGRILSSIAIPKQCGHRLCHPLFHVPETDIPTSINTHTGHKEKGLETMLQALFHIL